MSSQLPPTVTRAPGGEIGSSDAPGQVQVREPAGSSPGSADERYTVRHAIGQGGMGTVLLVRDKYVGRLVAWKELRNDRRDDALSRARFEREARLQGQLEHPAIVPVYDIGVTDHGDPFFTMRRVKGQPLSNVIRQLASGDGSRFTRRKLLSAFAQLCAAVHYAHERGVVHRDIKPANIMLGPYGEVYLLDWGVAKLLDEPPEALPPDESLEQRDAEGIETEHGNVVGTLSAMAPEQLQGEAVDARTDVYALGAVLFEILTYQPLHPKGTFAEVAAHILVGVDARTSTRAPELDVPPELEAICIAATRVDASLRTPSAMALHDAIEAYLDGDRDVTLRLESAKKHADAARFAAERLLGGHGADERGRAAALREVGRALALDPSNNDALGTLVRLLTSPPKIIPPEVLGEQREHVERRVRLAGFAAAAVYGYISLHGLATWQLGVRDVRSFYFAHALFAFALVGSLVTIWRRSYVPLIATFLFGMAASVSMTRIFSPWLMVPTMLTMHVVLFAMVQQWRLRLYIIGIACAGWTLSVFGSAWGIFPETVRYLDGSMIIHSSVLDLPKTRTTFYLYEAVLSMLIAPALVIGALRSAWQRSDEAMRLQAWQLRQLVSDRNDERR